MDFCGFGGHCWIICNCLSYVDQVKIREGINRGIPLFDKQVIATPLATVVEEQIAETASVSPPVSAIEKVIEVAITPVEAIQKTFDDVLNKRSD